MTTTRFSSQSVLAQGGTNKHIEDASIIPPVYTSTTYLISTQKDVTKSQPAGKNARLRSNVRHTH